MKKYIIKGLWQPVVLIAVMLLVGGVAMAATTSTSNVGGLTLPQDPSQSTSLPQRIVQRKASLKTALSGPESQRVSKACVLAQTSLQDIKTKDAAAADKRFVYNDLASRLATNIDHLERQSIDTTKVKAQQATFKNAINKYLADAATYKNTMDDAVVMGCEADPSGFEATLLSARQLRGPASS